MSEQPKPSPPPARRAELTPTSLAEPWAWTWHAERARRRRGFTLAEVLACANDPEVCYDSDQGKQYDERVYQRGRVAIIVNADARVIVTVLRRIQEPWGKHAGEPEPEPAPGTAGCSDPKETDHGRS